MDSRTKDLATVARLRNVRIEAVGQAELGNIAGILSDPTPEQAFVYVVKLLDVHPRLGKVSGRRLMARLGIAPFARVSDLTNEQIVQLIRECGDGQ